MFAATKCLLYHWTLIVGEIGDPYPYVDRWCYEDRQKAAMAIRSWDGVGEPIGW